MKVFGNEYVAVGSYVLLGKPYIDGKVVGIVQKIDGETNYVYIRAVYAEKENGVPAPESVKQVYRAPLLEVELFTGDAETVEAMVSAQML